MSIHYFSSFPVFSTTLNLPLAFVNLTFNSAALNTIALFFKADKLWAISPAYVLYFLLF